MGTPYDPNNPRSDSWTVIKAGVETPTVYGSGDSFLTGSGAPSNSLGQDGQYYFRSDTPGTANQRIYVKVSGSWTGIV